MPYLFVVNGIRLLAKAIDENDCDVSKSDEFKKINAKAKENGFLLQCSNNYEDDTTSFFVGSELLSSRHIYQSQTLCLKNENIGKEKEDVLNEIAAELKELVQGKYTLIKEDKGIVINQFD